MSVFEQLSHNKGTVSTTLGKTLAQEVFDGQTSVLIECIDLASYEKSKLNQNMSVLEPPKLLRLWQKAIPIWLHPT